MKGLLFTDYPLKPGHWTLIISFNSQVGSTTAPRGKERFELFSTLLQKHVPLSMPWTCEKQVQMFTVKCPKPSFLTWLSANNCFLWGWIPTRVFVINGRNVQGSLLTHKNGTHQEVPAFKKVQSGPQTMAKWLQFSHTRLSVSPASCEFQPLHTFKILSHVSGKKKVVFLKAKAVASPYSSN